MKTNTELRDAAKLAAENIANELNNGGGETVCSLSRLVTNAWLCSAALNRIQNRLAGTARENEE